ncbi:MAG: hypothetical protein P1U63_08810 [Coxiellaceae bacterium]|nr:hypothetical protein [Coxiellaceae bacterium]
MSKPTDDFWKSFNQQNFGDAAKALGDLETSEQQAVLESLYQKSGNEQQPFMVSVLRRKLHDGETFDDFYKSWQPDPAACQPTEVGGQQYRQFFPISTRVVNGVNIADQSDIISVGFTWVKNDEEKNGLFDYIQSASEGKEAENQKRHDDIAAVAEGGLLGLFVVEADDNLGTPF